MISRNEKFHVKTGHAHVTVLDVTKQARSHTRTVIVQVMGE